MKKVIALLMLFMVLATALVFPAVAEEAAEPTASVNLTPFLEAFVGLLAALVTGFLIPWVKSKTTAQQQMNIQMVMDVLVYAAEQIYGSDKGQLKLEYVEKQMAMRGFTVDIAQIEAAVRRMNVWSPSPVELSTEE